ncbi:MAG: RNA methyltransferase [Cyanobacteria bacterium RM1_2_2]|nr:RNA methyltransferase [Cyanobacteria bacterium RM1_2_2]
MTERTPVQRSINRADYGNLPRHSLIVCASLVQNPGNLGRLCRTVEAFRLKALVLADLEMTENPAFRNSAASSHHWQPLWECSLDALPDWLSQQQQVGYTLVAMNANPATIPLPQFTFPLQTVLLLGQELTGIPSDLLRQCNACVTIPQFGLVESLNVQTAGSIAIYEYMRQHAF